MKRMAPFIFLTLAWCYGISQLDCSGGRYYDDVFQNVTVYSGLVYGQNTNVQGTNQILKLDIYKPTGDTVTQRPVIIFAFGGSFVFGLRSSPDIVQLCNALARKGYVCASIDYRLGLSPDIIPVINADNVKKAIWRVTHDMRAAVRWMRMNADVDSLGVDTSRIIVGGVSAGGFGALHSAYLDEESEIPAVMDTVVEGGVEGSSGNPGYSSRPWAVINLCGALLDTTWMKAGDPPVVTLQGNLDASVPYCTDVEKVFGTPITGLIVAGGNPVERRAWNLGIPTGFYTWWGADHTPFVLPLGGPSVAQYMDTTIWYIRDFLSNQLCNTAFTYSRDSLTEAYCGTISGISETIAEDIRIFPNPAKDMVVVQIPDSYQGVSKWSASVFDAPGRLVLSQQQTDEGKQFVIRTSDFSPGVYFLKVTDGAIQKTVNLFIK